jgi:TonB-dependent receptor
LPAGGVIYTGTDSGVATSNTVSRDYSTGFTWTPGGGRLTIKAAGQIVDSTSVANNLDIFGQVEFPSVFGLDLRGKLPQVLVPSSGQAAFDDLTRNQWTAAMPHNEDNHGKLHAVNLDLEYKFDDGSFFRSIKAGGRYAERTERDLNNGYAWAALGRGWNGDPQLTFANAKPGDIERYSFNDFFHGGSTPPGLLYFPSVALVSQMNLAALHASPPAGFCVNYYPCEASAGATPTGYGGGGIRTPGFLLPDDQTYYSTKTTAGYVLARFGRDDSDGGMGFNGNVGVRIVRTENSSSGFYTQSPTQFFRNGTLYTLASSRATLSNGASFTRVLPSINLQLLPTPKTHLRFGYNITMDNASFSALRAQGSLGVNTTTPQGAPPGTPANFLNFTTSSGNPTLKPTMSNNLDLSFEWYPKNGTTLHVAAFYKHITDLPIYRSTLQPVQVFYSAPTATSTIEQAQTLDVANATKPATVRGVEVGGRTFFDMLPGIFGAFGVEANYTFISSKNPGDQYTDIAGNIRNDIPVQGLSRNNLNVTLMYERNPISARIAYSWRSKYLQTTTGNGTSGGYNYIPTPGANPQAVDISLPIYGDAYGTLDAGVTFKVTKNFSFAIQATNLLNATARTLQGGYPNGALFVRSWFQSDRRISTGINLAF